MGTTTEDYTVIGVFGKRNKQIDSLGKYCIRTTQGVKFVGFMQMKTEKTDRN